MSTTEAQVIERTIAEMRRQGVGVTPERVERVVNAVQGSAGGDSPDQLRRLKARKKELDQLLDNPATSDQARAKAAAALIKVLEEIQALEAALHPTDRIGAPATAGNRVTVGEALTAVNALLAKLREREQRALLQDRTVVGMCLAPRNPDGSGGEVRKVIRTGPKREAQFAQPTPYFRLSDLRRAELEGEAAGLKAKIETPGLDPVLRNKLKQDLAKIEHLLRLDASPAPDMRPSAERRVQD